MPRWGMRSGVIKIPMPHRKANMTRDRAIQKSLQLALRNQLERQTDAKGYVCTPTENLIDGISLEQFEDDLRGGDGDELGGKF